MDSKCLVMAVFAGTVHMFENNLNNQNSVQKAIESRLMSGDDCRNLVQNVLSSILLYKN